MLFLHAWEIQNYEIEAKKEKILTLIKCNKTIIDHQLEKIEISTDLPLKMLLIKLWM